MAGLRAPLPKVNALGGMYMYSFRRLKNWKHEQLFFSTGISQSAVVVLFFMRLGNMQMDGVLPISVALVAVAIAFTSLMYNRVRAVSNRVIQFRSLFAAENSLRASVFFLIYALFVAIIFPWLTGLGYVPTRPDKWPTQIAPMFASLVAAGFFLLGMGPLLRSLRIMVPSPIGIVSPRHIRRLLQK